MSISHMQTRQSAGSHNRGDPPPSLSNMEQCLSDVLKLLYPIIEEVERDAAMARLILSSEEFIEPLTKHETFVLACALHVAASSKGRAFDFKDVLDLTERFGGRPMVTAMIFKSVTTLLSRGLIVNEGKTGRAPRSYSINEAGRVAFQLSIANARHLASARESVSA